jgi:anti-sigma factor RsiW
MKCEDARTLLDGYADGELDLVNHLQIEQHLGECADCEKIYQDGVAMRLALSDKSLYFRAPISLREAIKASIREADPAETPRARWSQWRWTPVLAAATVLAAVLITSLTVLRPSVSNEDLLAKEFVASHVRSMMVDHLMDVPSTDQHTVKPWFADKLDFSPPVVDLGAQGFALEGGRLDYATGRPVAALVYRRRGHVINLFIFPATDNPDSPGKTLARQGFNLIHWNRSGMTFWAVSDLNVNELQEFVQDLQN